jgi:hypothetical protein
MFRPVGSLPPSVYWRRRFILLGSLVALLALLVVTVSVVLSGNSDPKQGAHGASPGTSTPTAPPRHHQTSSPESSQSSSRDRHKTSTTPKSTSVSSDTPESSDTSVPPARCNVKRLALAAETDQPHYTMDELPQLSILVTNNGSQPCVQDLADPQVILSVFNGEARVWGSHDCKIEPGTNDQTLMPGHSVRVSITWTGLSSKPHCAGTRQRVGAGSYTLYATLSGQQAKSAQFTIG